MSIKHPKTKFTDAFIKSLKPEDMHYVVREEAPRGEGGFCIRVMKSGAKTWQMIYSFEGSRKQLSLGEYPALSLAKAREKFREMRKILAGGQDPGEVTRTKAQERRDSWTINKLCDEFLEKYSQVKKRPRSAREDELNLKRDIRPTWGKRKARDIRRGDVVSLLDQIVERGAGVQANRTLATVRKMFNWALEREVLEFNPALGISKPTVERPNDRALSMAEITTVWKTMDANNDVPDDIKKALKLLLLTGCRATEVLEAKWEQIDGDWLELSSKSTKTWQAHRVYLSSLTKQLIGEQGKDLIVSRADGANIPAYVLSYWTRRCNHFGISPWKPQHLRTTFTTRLAEMGVPDHILDRATNHAQKGITARVYNKYNYATEISKAVQRWGESVEQAVTGRKTKAKIINLER